MAAAHPKNDYRTSGEIFVDCVNERGFKRVFVYPLLLLLPTFYTFIAIILINIGGYNTEPWPDRRASSSPPKEGNQAYALLKWEWIVTNSNITGSISPYATIENRTEAYSAYLHQICREAVCKRFDVSQNNFDPAAPGYTGMSMGLVDYVGNTYHFSKVYFSAPYAFYVLAAVCIVLLWFINFVHVIRQRFWTGRVALGLSLAGLISVVVASAVLTSQTVELASQMQNNVSVVFGRGRVLGLDNFTFYGSSDTYFIHNKQTHIQSTALCLTWAAVVAMALDVAKWSTRSIRHKDQLAVAKVDGDTVVQG